MFVCICGVISASRVRVPELALEPSAWQQPPSPAEPSAGHDFAFKDFLSFSPPPPPQSGFLCIALEAVLELSL